MKENGSHIHTTDRKEPWQPKFHIVSNSVMHDLADGIAQGYVDWLKLLSDYKPTPQNNRRARLNGDTSGYYYEKYIESVVDVYVKNGKVSPVPLEDGHESENFLFKKKLHNITVKDKNSGIDVGEYDAVVMADGTPVIIEAKLAKSLEINSKEFRSKLYPKNIQKIISPLREAFSTSKFGFMLVTNPEVAHSPSRLLTTFEEMGGIIVSPPISYQRFMSELDTNLALYSAE